MKSPKQAISSLDEREQREFEYIRRDHAQQHLDDDDSDWNRNDDWTDYLQDYEQDND